MMQMCFISPEDALASAKIIITVKEVTRITKQSDKNLQVHVTLTNGNFKPKMQNTPRP